MQSDRTTARVLLVPEETLDDAREVMNRAAERLQVQSTGAPDNLVLALRTASRELGTHTVVNPWD